MYKKNSECCNDNKCCECRDGRDGRDGQDGERGPPGAQGNPGPTTLTRAGIPISGTGANGDLFINTITNGYYVKTNGTWVIQGSLTGTQGAPGPQAIRAFIAGSGVVISQFPLNSINVIHVSTGKYIINFTTSAPTAYSIVAQSGDITTFVPIVPFHNNNIIIQGTGTSSASVTIRDFGATFVSEPVNLDADFAIVAFPI